MACVKDIRPPMLEFVITRREDRVTGPWEGKELTSLSISRLSFNEGRITHR